MDTIRKATSGSGRKARGPLTPRKTSLPPGRPVGQPVKHGHRPAAGSVAFCGSDFPSVCCRGRRGSPTQCESASELLALCWREREREEESGQIPGAALVEGRAMGVPAGIVPGEPGHRDRFVRSIPHTAMYQSRAGELAPPDPVLLDQTTANKSTRLLVGNGANGKLPSVHP